MSIFKILAQAFMAIFSRQRLLSLYSPRKTKPRSVFIRHFDAGSCNDCELEIGALTNPVYDLERFGFHIVASPRHADVLLITGPFTRGMERSGRAAFDAMPDPKRIVTVGDGFSPDNLFKDSYATIPLPETLDKHRVAHISGDPPSPSQLLDVLLESDSE